MIRTATCPNDLALQQYAEGWSDPASTLEVEEHLAICSKCEGRLSLIETDRAADGLIESLRLRGQLTAQRIEPATPTAMSDSDSEDPGFQQVLAEIQEWSPEKPDVSDPELDLPRALGQYELLALIGQGGMAHVYRARHSKLQRTVAIKLLHVPKWQVDRSLARLEREIAVVGQLHHSAIVAATDAGQHDGTPYLVTEFIDGLNLSQLARAVPLGSTPNTADVCEVIRVAALGLAHAHSQGVTHRDIKPSNLMIDRQGHVKILDFGLVHLEGWQDEALELTTVGQLLGTLDYMAPEQADKATAVDHRSDIYALGATLFRLLCGRAPYAASLYQSPLEKLRLLAMTDPPKVATLRPDLPVELAELVNQSLNRDPAKRPPSAAHLAEALLPFCQEAKLGAWVQWALEHPPVPVANDQPSPGALLRPSQDLLPGKKTESATQSSGRGRRWWPWALTAAAGAAAIWLSIILILDTQKGQLVIESESADVRVTLRKDGQESETLQLEPGLNLTRVFAGTYQIEIDGPADAYQLDRNTIIIKRGEVVLAKVSRRTVGQLDNTQPATTDPASSETVFTGITHAEWLRRFRVETNPSEKLKAFMALVSFKNSAQVEKTRSALLEYVALGEPHGLIFTEADSIGGIDAEQWQQLPGLIAKLPPAARAKLIHDLRGFARPFAYSPNRGTPPHVPSGERVLQYFDFVENQLVTTGASWSVLERSNILNGVIELVRQRYRDSDEQRAVETRFLELTENAAFDHRCWYAVRNDDFWEQHPSSRSKIDAALIQMIPAKFEVNIEFLELLLSLNSIHSRCSNEQRSTITKKIDQLLQSVDIVHFRMKSGYFELSDLNGYSAELFENPSERIARSNPSSSSNVPDPRTDWENGAQQLLAYCYARQLNGKDINSQYLHVAIPAPLQTIAGERNVWLSEYRQRQYSWHHLIDCLVVTYIRFLPKTENYQAPQGVVHIGNLVANLIEPLAKEIATFGEPGQLLILSSSWSAPETSSRIRWKKDDALGDMLTLTREQLCAALVSASIDSALRGETPSGPIWDDSRGPALIRRLSTEHESSSTDEPVDPSANTPSDSSDAATQTPQPAVDEPTYKGHPFSYWAAIFRTEREPSIRLDAFKNMQNLPGDPMPLLVEVIVSSNRGPRQNIMRILESHSSLIESPDHWTQIEESIKHSDETTHVDSIIELSCMARIYAVNANRQLIPDPTLDKFLALTTRLTDEYSHKWSSDSRTNLIETLVPWLTASDNVNEEFRAKIVNIVGNCLRAGNIDRDTWLRLGSRDFIKVNSELRTLAIEALMGGSDRPYLASPETAYELFVASLLMEEVSELREPLFQRVDRTLKAASSVELKTYIPELDRNSGIEVSFYKSNDNRGDRSISTIFPETTNGSGAIAPSTPAEFSFDASGNQVLIGNVNTNVTVGELLVALWKLLANEQQLSGSSILDELLEKTRADHATFIEQLRSQLAPNYQRASVFFYPEMVTIERRAYDKNGDLVRRKRTFGGLPIGELPENHFPEFVDQIWKRLDFERDTVAPVGTDRGPIKFSVDMDFDGDQRVSQGEFYQYVFGQHPTQTLEGITPEIAHGMLLHRHLLTLLDRPIPKIDFGDSTTESELENTEDK
jgi:serine/threonine protein kinase